MAGPTSQPPPVLSGCERGADFGGQFGPTARPGGFHFVQFSFTQLLTVKEYQKELIDQEDTFIPIQISEESCTISPDLFLSKYVMQRKPVVLKVLHFLINYTSGSRIVINKSTRIRVVRVI